MSSDGTPTDPNKQTRTLTRGTCEFPEHLGDPALLDAPAPGCGEPEAPRPLQDPVTTNGRRRRRTVIASTPSR